MRVAIFHYWFLMKGGGERVVETLAKMYPEADLFCLFGDRESLPDSLKDHNLRASYLDAIPMARKLNRLLFPAYPSAVASIDLKSYDLVITSDSPPTKNIVIRPGAVHVSYCHTPPRYMWDQRINFSRTLPALARPLFSTLADRACRMDFEAAQRVHGFAANSRFTAKRITEYYNRESEVIYPPVEVGNSYLGSSQGDYYLTVGRLVGAKRVDLLIRACNEMGRRLVIAGTGRDEAELRAIAGPTIEFLGFVPDEKLPELYANCKAFLFAALEDFGIAPVEAQGYGKPVIAYGDGGALEIVSNHGSSDQPTGVYFSEQSVESVVEAMLRFESVQQDFDPAAIRKHAMQFDTATFENRMSNFIDRVCAKVAQQQRPKTTLPNVVSSYSDRPRPARVQ